jgi:hypothetical protein
VDVLNAANAVCSCASSYPAPTCTGSLTGTTTGPGGSGTTTGPGGSGTTPPPTSTRTPCSVAPGPTQCDASVSAIPPCATNCIVSAGAQYGCSKLDFWCQCEPDTYTNIKSAALNCVVGACGVSGAVDVLNAANAVCSCASSYPAPTCTGSPTGTGTGPGGSGTTTGPGGSGTTPPPTGTGTPCSVAPGPTQCDASASAIPPCATDCIISAGAQFGCSELDFWCQCVLTPTPKLTVPH